MARRFLMDVQMPVMDGLSAVRALTAHAMEGDAQECLSSGMDRYLSKPVQPQQLWDMIDAAVLRALRPERSSWSR